MIKHAGEYFNYENIKVHMDSQYALSIVSPEIADGAGTWAKVGWSFHSELQLAPDSSTIIALFSPPEALLDLVEESEGGKEAMRHPPVKAHHLGEGMNSRSGSVDFLLLNLRTDYIFGLFQGGSDNPVLVAVSEVLLNGRPNEPNNIHLALADEGEGHGAGLAAMRVSWVTRDEGRPVVMFQEEGPQLASGAVAPRHLRSVRRLMSHVVGGKVLGGATLPTATKHSVAPASSFTFSAKDMCTAPASGAGFHSPGTLHSVVLANLTPGTRYRYRVGDLESQEWSEYRVFVTPPAPSYLPTEQSVRIAVFGDMGAAPIDGSYESTVTGSQWASLGTAHLLESLLEKPSQQFSRSPSASGLDAVLHIGDISYARGVTFHWDMFLQEIEQVASHVPWMVGIGNHERDSTDVSDTIKSLSFFFTDDSGGECGVPYGAYFPMPEPADDFKKDTPWYSFDYGAIHFTVMSTEHDFRRGSSQFQWLKQDLKDVHREVTPWVVFAGHRPMYVDSTWGGDFDSDVAVSDLMKQELEPMLMEHQVDIGLYGHHHSYQRTCQVFDGECQDTSASEPSVFVAPVHLVVGMGGYDFSEFAESTPDWIDFQSNEQHGASVIEANHTHLHFQFFDGINYQQVDELWMKK
eukprot:CAMPEP_0113945674 /NCGR_PEP_ID=MMETSP1339-20121228/49363_1 /TAXON_ID=94617 /ORGANISM="Fibrocapsa japonica" /LENGTH=632 /DNA_ID=CAMNT_0000951363 /DNA_START=100 /DNA_END=1998 /DNA_ORIENTATION=+ /assembly_acc=CAM_ASM_000762